MDISQVDEAKCKLDNYNDHEQIFLFNELYKKYNKKPKLKEVTKKSLKESKEIKKESETTVEKKVPMDLKFKKNVNDGLHKKLYEANCNGDTHDKLSKDFGISKYMVAKLIKQAREERKSNQNCKAESEAVPQQEKKEEETQEVEATA